MNEMKALNELDRGYQFLIDEKFDRKDMLLRELEGRLKYLPEDVAVREFRSVMPYYVKGLPGSAQIKVKLVNAVSFDEVKEIIELA